MKTPLRFGVLGLILTTAAHPAFTETLKRDRTAPTAQQITVALPGRTPGDFRSMGHVQLQVRKRGCCDVRIEIRCIDGCSARYSQDLQLAEFNGALLLGVHPESGDVDIATLWGEGTGWTVRVFNVSSTKARAVLDVHTNASPEFKVDYIGHDGLVVPDEVDYATKPLRFAGATVYQWNGARFAEQRIKSYRPREWWSDSN